MFPCCATEVCSVWDSLAICEYIAELTGAAGRRTARRGAVARSVCAEMHSALPTCARSGR